VTGCAALVAVGIAWFDDYPTRVFGRSPEFGQKKKAPRVTAGDRGAKRDKHHWSLVLSNERLRSFRSPDLEA